MIEDVPGPSLEEMLERDPDRAQPVLTRLASAVRILHADKSPAFGKVGYLDQGGTGRGGSCEQVVLDRAMRDLAEASARDPRIARAGDRPAGILRRQAAKVRPRTDYSLIHGELDPGHVLVDREGQPVLIDIEGLMYFDAEWEHVFLRLRYGSHYRVLHRGEGPQRRWLQTEVKAERLVEFGHGGGAPRPSRAAVALAVSLLTTTAGRTLPASDPRTGSQTLRRPTRPGRPG